MAATEGPDDAVSFNRDVRPILSENCYTCHGPHEASRKRDLRLDTEAGLFGQTREGFDLIAPANPQDSEVYLRLVHEDVEERMPPADSGRVISQDEIDVIRRWIEQGADYEAHWAFIPPERHENPVVRWTEWARDDIDYHILSRLEAEGLSPSPEADKGTLIRRVSYDLTGLPPSRAEVRAFLEDDAPDAYERLVDRLLASPHYGERMAQAWMDWSRYADTNGYSIDGGREMWLWRDWVIQAFNEDKPYDDFIREQIAGDLMENATDQQVVATGFSRNHMITHEGGTIPEENLTNYCVDRVRTTSEVFMGLTMACAQCHDHKFDPISQKEYYQFYAYFNQLSDRGLDGNAGKNAEPIITARTAIAHSDAADIAGRIAELKEALSERRPALQAAWEEEQRAALARRGRNMKLHALEAISAKSPNLDPTRIEILEDGSIFARGHFTQAYTISLKVSDTAIPPVTGMRIEFYPHPEVAEGSIGYGSGDKAGAVGINAVSVSTGALPSDELDLYGLVPLDRATASYSHSDYPARSVLDPSTSNAWSPLGRVKEPQHLTVVFDAPVDAEGTPYFTVMLVLVNRNTGLSSPGHFRILALTGEDDGTELPADIRDILAIAPDDRSGDQAERIHGYHVAHDANLEGLRVELANLERRYAEMTEPFSTLVMDTAEDPRKTHVLDRGQYDRPGEEVQPGTPAVLPPLPEDAPPNRLALADWLVDADHPLTSRVTVNLLWQLFFGTGIVATPADFGSQGEPPIHPELLDTLAVDFVESGWQVKRMVKRIVMSSTYRQSSRVRPESLEIDPRNRLLSYSPRFRLQGEFIRDGALKVSGLLVPWIGGSSVKPYQPENLWREVSHYGSTPATSQAFERDEGRLLYRRSLYTYWKRTLPPPSMTAFDAPNREVCTMRRGTTNTPMQALVLLNDVQFVEASRMFAERLLHDLPGATDRGRLRYAFEAVTSRPPTREEVVMLEQAYAKQRRRYEEQPEAAAELLALGEMPRDASLDPVEHAALTMVTNLLLNLSEAVTRG